MHPSAGLSRSYMLIAGKRLLLSCAILAAPLRAQASATGAAALNWVHLPGADGCIPAAELATRVEARLERRVFVRAQDALISLDGFVEPRAEGGFVAHLAVSDMQGKRLGTRDVESAEASCRALDDALVLIAALTLFPGDFGVSGGIALDPEINARLHALFGDEPSELDPAELPVVAAAPGTMPPSAPEEQARRADALPPSAARQAQPRPRSLFTIEAAPVAALGVLPGVALGAAAELTLALPTLWPVRLGFAHFFSRSAHASRPAMGTGHFERSELSLFTCPVWGEQDLALELCTGATLGLLHVTTEGFALGGIHANDAVFDLGAQGGVRLRLAGPVHARLSVGAFLPLVQRVYQYQALDASSARLFRSSQVAGRLLLGLGAEF